MQHGEYGKWFQCSDVDAGGRVLVRISQLESSGTWGLRQIQNIAIQTAKSLSTARAAAGFHDLRRNEELGAVQLCSTGRLFLEHGMRGYISDVQEDDYVPPKPFDTLKTTFGSLQLVDYAGDFEERLEKEPVKPILKPPKEPEKPLFVSLWSRFIEEEGLTDFTDLEAIRAVALKNPHAQTLVDTTCEKVSKGEIYQL